MQDGNPFSSLLESWAQWFGRPPQADDADVARGTQMIALQQEALTRHAQLWQSQLLRKPGAPVAPVIAPARGDWRFIAPEWSESPFHDYLRQAYLINADYLMRAAELMPLADEAERKCLRFMTRQYVDALAPSNFAATNPEFIQQAILTHGESTICWAIWTRAVFR